MTSIPDLPLLAIASLGGTISMTPDAAAGGVVPRLDAQQLAASVPGLEQRARLIAEPLFQLPSASIQTAHLLSALQWAEAQIVAGAQGVILTQGTDSIEETAFLLDLYWQRPEPLVVTGAMRAPLMLSADGPANLMAASLTALHPASRGRGVLVVMNDEVHAARWVRKTHSLALQAFTSPNIGPLARVLEHDLHYLQPPFRAHRPLPLPAGFLGGSPASEAPRVALIETFIDDDGRLAVLAAEAGYQGLVIAAMGAGHVSFAFAEQIDALCQRMPVVMASRTGAGPTASATYAYSGSEIDLQRRGAWMAGWLCARKARLLLWALLADGQAGDGLKAAWENSASHH